MPAVYTHYIFTKEVYSKLKLSTKNQIKNELDLFEIFGKSFDILFFSDSKLGHLAYNFNINLYFKNILLYIRKNNLQNDEKVLSYLYGSICHYILDSICHPYVFYRTGKFNFRDKNSYKYKGLHNYYEYMIDSILYFNHNKRKMFQDKVYKLLFPKFCPNKSLKLLINYVILNTFNSRFGYLKFRIGYLNFRLAFKYIMFSKVEYKKKIYSILDKLNLFKNFNLSNLCYYIPELDYDVMNYGKKNWCNPVNDTLISNYSFDELFSRAIKKAVQVIETVNSVLQNNQPLNVALKVIGNFSYCSGSNLNLNLKMQYFDF